MRIVVSRKLVSKESTLGLLSFDGFHCYTLEDPPQAVKIPGMTRIPAGEYRIELRAEGGMHARYAKRYGADWHRGMLWLRKVPDFEYVYIHIGNIPDDTKGCILVGHTLGRDSIGKSREAYRELYPRVRDAVLNGDIVTITIED